MARRVAIGIQDFGKLLKHNCFYVDKTLFIKEWWENMDDVTLITRPRRFGKTLTMSMLEQFFSVNYAQEKAVFEKLNIWEYEEYRGLQGTYPVIFLSFSRVKGNSYPYTRMMMNQILTEMYGRNRYLLDGDLLSEAEKKYFHEVCDTMQEHTAVAAIHRLSEFLYRFYKKKPLIFLDEYDTPMQEAYLGGYWEEMSAFIRAMFNASFKENPYMERAILTGITRVSKESVFSDLNNLKVITTTSVKYETSFGFTEEEVLAALAEYGLLRQKQDVKRWYDGFRFGNRDSIYNPWSIINFLDERQLRAFWVNTSSNSMVGKLIHSGGAQMKLVMEELLLGRSFQTYLDEEIVFKQLNKSKTAVWSLLLASGYLKALQVKQNSTDKQEYVLALTNKEVCMMFDEMVMGWFSNQRLDYDEFSKALLAGNKEFMNEYLNEIAEETFSSFDTGAKPSEFKQPENFYHGFTLGLIAGLRNIYHITSNRESGYGRYDVVLEPFNQDVDDGIILEFKVRDTKKEASLQETVDAALRQIAEKKYAAALLAKRIKPQRIRIYGIAFQGKHILLDGGKLADL